MACASCGKRYRASRQNSTALRTAKITQKAQNKGKVTASGPSTSLQSSGTSGDLNAIASNEGTLTPTDGVEKAE